eukprot:gene24335-biopygen9973
MGWGGASSKTNSLLHLAPATRTEPVLAPAPCQGIPVGPRGRFQTPNPSRMYLQDLHLNQYHTLTISLLTMGSEGPSEPIIYHYTIP